MEYTIKIVPLAMARQFAEEATNKKAMEREQRYQNYLTRISKKIADCLATGAMYGEAVCGRYGEGRIFTDEELALKAAKAVAEAYEKEGYKVDFYEYGMGYKKICRVGVTVPPAEN